VPLEQVKVEEIKSLPDRDVRKPELLRQLKILRVAWRTPVLFDTAMDGVLMQEI
jgi:hypothetical protein